MGSVIIKVHPGTRLLLKGLLAAPLMVTAGCATQSLGVAQEQGLGYRVAPKPWPVNRDRRVEVAEFFWYGCPACAAFEPVLKAWHAPKASAVVLRKLHPVANPGWLAAAQLHASLLTMGIANALSDRLYAAIHQQGAPLASQADAIELAASLGVDRAGIMSAWRAAQTRAHMDTAQQMARFFRVDGVPTLVVGGRWITSPKIAGGVKPLFRVLGQLVSLAGRSA